MFFLEIEIRKDFEITLILFQYVITMWVRGNYQIEINGCGVMLLSDAFQILIKIKRESLLIFWGGYHSHYHFETS